MQKRKKKSKFRYMIYKNTKKEICNCFYIVYNNFALNRKYEILKKKIKNKSETQKCFLYQN